MACGGDEEVKLLGTKLISYVRRVEWALKFKGIPYVLLEEDLANKSPLLLKLNPIYKQVPVLLHNNERAIPESLLILEYIDQTWTHSPMLLPEDPYDRAAARFWVRFIDEKFGETTKKIVVLEGEEQEKEVKQARLHLETIERELTILDNVVSLKDNTNDVGIVDIVFGSIFVYLPAVEEVSGVTIMEAGKYPGIVKWMRNFMDRSVIKENLPPMDKMVRVFGNVRRLGLASSAEASIDNHPSPSP